MTFGRLVLLSILALILVTGVAHASDARKLNQAIADFKKAMAEGSVVAQLSAAQRSFDLGEDYFEKSDPRRITLSMNLAVLLANTMQVDAARLQLEKTLKIGEDVYGKHSVALVPMLEKLVEVSDPFSDSRRQRKYLDRIIQLNSRTYGKESAEYASSLEYAAREMKSPLLRRQKESYFKKALKARTDFAGHVDIMAARTAQELGREYKAWRKRDWAISAYETALEGFENSEDTTDSELLAVHRELFELLSSTGRTKRADQHLAKLKELHITSGAQKPLRIWSPEIVWPPGVDYSEHAIWVRVRFTVDENGNVSEPVVDGSGVEETSPVPGTHAHFRAPPLDSEMRKFEIEARRYVQRCRYLPATVDGTEVASEEVMQTVLFAKVAS